MITLSRKLKVESYEVSMVVGKKDTKRADILAFLRLVNERSNTITARVANLDFFMEKIEDHAYGPRWIWSMSRYGYIEPVQSHHSDDDIDFQKEVFRLTPFGQEVVNAGTVYLPQSGNFIAHYTDDSLLEERELLALVPMEQVSVGRQWNDDEWASRDKTSLPPRSVELPRALKELGQIVVELPAQGMEKQMVIEVKSNAFISKRSLEVSTEIQLAPGQPAKLTIVTGEGKRTELDLPHPIDYQTVMREIARAEKIQMDEDQESVLVSFDEVDDKELHALKRQLPDCKYTLAGLGEFDVRFTNELPLRPQHLDDASRWASRLLMEELDDYVTEEGYGILVKEYAEKFTPWYPAEEVISNMPSFIEVLLVANEYARRGDQRHWFLRAPIDLDGRVVE